MLKTCPQGTAGLQKKVHKDNHNGFSRADLYLGLHRQGFRPPTQVQTQPQYE